MQLEETEDGPGLGTERNGTARSGGCAFGGATVVGWLVCLDIGSRGGWGIHPASSEGHRADGRTLVIDTIAHLLVREDSTHVAITYIPYIYMKNFHTKLGGALHLYMYFV